jgi:fatty acyl-CoA reductase
VHWLPAYIVDFIIWTTGRKPVVRKIIAKMHKGIDSLEYFANREWTWSNDNVLALDDELNETDSTLFNFRLHDLDWEDFVRQYYLGVRHIVMKYEPETMDACRKRIRIMYLVYHVARGLITAGVVYYILTQFARILGIF